MANASNQKAIAIGLLAVLGIGGAVYFIDQANQPNPIVAPEEANAGTSPPEAAPTAVVPSSSEKSLNFGAADAQAPDIVGTTTAEDTVDRATPAPLRSDGEAAADLSVETASTGIPEADTDGVSVGTLAPAIDTFFRNPDETTVIAGRAPAGQTVAIVLGREELDRVVAGPDGTFGAVVFISAADQPRRLRLIGDPDGEAVASAETVIVPPSAPQAIALATEQEDAAEAEQGDAGSNLQANSEGITDQAEDAAIAVAEASPVGVGTDVDATTAPQISSQSPSGLGGEAAEAPEASAPPTLIADAGGVRVIQPSDDTAGQPELIDNIALDTITYDTTGDVILSGRAETGGFVQIYLDNQPITTSRISDQGDWSIDLPDVDTGVYTLRVDEVDFDGNVQSRIETPFKREERAAVAAIMAEETDEDGFDVAVKTVQPGNTLWAIAEERFGEGIMYVAVFEANKDLIRDPDLIYPGQVFRLPEVAEE